MATVTQPVPDARVLRNRLAALRRRLYGVTILRGVSWLLTILLLGAVVGGVLDWRFHLPGLVRAVILVATLTGSAFIAFRFLFKPLSGRTDDLSLALRVEESYPWLNDALASTVEFLDDSDSLPVGISPSLQREAMRRAGDKINSCNFNRVVDSSGLMQAVFSMIFALLAFGLLAGLRPALAGTALLRLTNPFGAATWPSQTKLTRLSAGPMDHPVELISEDTVATTSDSAIRIGRGQVFVVRAMLAAGNEENGVLPRRAVVLVHSDGGSVAEHSCEVLSVSNVSGQFEAKLDTAHFAREFKFRVVAHDAVSPEYKVLVQQPPILLPLDGKPSPQVTLDYPAYTGLPSPQALPAGLGDVDAVNGTALTLRARADRPLARAWVEYQPDLKSANVCVLLAVLGVKDAVGAIASLAGGTALDVVEAQLESDGSLFTVRMRPSFTGMYVLHFEDETHLSNSRPFALRLRPDPAPTVQLERPSPSRDVLTVLAEAELPVSITADDTIYAIRSVALAYRTGAHETTRSVVLYHHSAAPRNLLPPVTGPAFLAGAPLRLRPTHLECAMQLALSSLKHDDGTPLHEGDIVTLQALAEDFDDVSVDKQPGRSAEVEIRIIGRNALDVLLNQEQTRIQQDLLRQREKERDAEAKVMDAEHRLKKGDKLNAEDRTQLLQAEQLQQQIRERIGNEKEGLRAEVQRVLQTVDQNRLQNSAVRERMKDLERELQRIGEKELEQIEPRIADVRTLAELMEEQTGDAYRARMEKQAKQSAEKARAAEKEARDKRATADKAEELASKRSADDPEKNQLVAEAQKARQQAELLDQKAREFDQQAAAERRAMEKPDLKTPQQQLAAARRDQEEVERTLNDLLDRLEPWTSSREIKGEAGKILEEQKKLLAELEELKKDEKQFLGKTLAELTLAQKTELDNLWAAQKKLEERTDKLLEKMKRVAEERADKDPETAKTLEQARNQGLGGNVRGEMRQARDEIKQNELQQAKNSQQRAADQLQKMVKSMEDRRTDELERLIKKMKETEHELAQLANQQEELKKKVKEAEKIADPAKREEALKKLALQQRSLQEKTEQLAKQLTRLRNDAPGRELGRASGGMEQAGNQLRNGENPEQKQDDVLERIQDAQRAMEKERKKVEDELVREQLTRFADVLKRLRERQAGFNAEGVRIQKEVVKRYKESIDRDAAQRTPGEPAGDPGKTALESWGRGLRASLTDLARFQQDLGTETASSAGKELANTPVFQKQVQRSAESMGLAGKRLEEMYKSINNRTPPLPEDLPDAEATRLQNESLRRLDQLLEALKSETEALAKRAASEGAGGGGDDGNGGAPSGDEGLPPLGQIKLLRAMQGEVNQAIVAFQKKNPNMDKLGEKEKTEYQAIQRDQRDVLNLLEALRNPDAEVGAKEGDQK
jgi:hypothetical protein